MKITIVVLLAGLTVAAASPQFDNQFGGRRGRQGRQGRQNGGGRGGRNGNRGGRGGGGRGRGGAGRCGGGNRPNYSFGGQDFLVSWKLGCSSFTNRGGEEFCRANGMKPISIDSQAKENEFLNLVGRERQKYFWTGGKVRGRKITWPSGRRYNRVAWSNTGGLGEPQPDNREGDEFCVAVLNNFYKDGIRFHDVSCHHKKPIICES